MMSSASYKLIDPEVPAVFLPMVIGELPRGDLGFTGFVMTDDLSAARQVRAWSPGERAVDAITAGCDAVGIGESRDCRADGRRRDCPGPSRRRLCRRGAWRRWAPGGGEGGLVARVRPARRIEVHSASRWRSMLSGELGNACGVIAREAFQVQAMGVLFQRIASDGPTVTTRGGGHRPIEGRSNSARQ